MPLPKAPTKPATILVPVPTAPARLERIPQEPEARGPETPVSRPAPATGLAVVESLPRGGGRKARSTETPKLFVLDTNVLLHDPTSPFRFEEHDIFLPMMTLEELDAHKTFDSWVSAELGGGTAKVCYMFARPTASDPKGAKRGEIMVVITHRPGAKRQDEVSFQSGYPFKDGAPVAVDIDGKKFEFFTRVDIEAEAAWARDPAAEKAIVAAM